MARPEHVPAWTMQVSIALRSVSLLVVEDDPDTLALYVASIGAAGGVVHGTRDAGEALEFLARWRPDAVLCDLHLPGVDGYDLLSLIRARPELHDVPVVAISGSHPDLERPRSITAGFAGYLVKPARLAEIVGSITRLVPAARERAAPEPVV